jgi:ABC-type transport system involved in cytochrome c biogenesis permease subunit
MVSIIGINWSKWLALSTGSVFFFTNYLSLFKMGRIRSFPLSNLYESLLFLSWVLTFLLVVSNIKLNTFVSLDNSSSIKKIVQF